MPLMGSRHTARDLIKCGGCNLFQISRSVIHIGGGWVACCCKRNASKAPGCRAWFSADSEAKY